MNIILGFFAIIAISFLGVYLLGTGLQKIYIDHVYKSPLKPIVWLTWFFLAIAGFIMLPSSLFIGTWIARGFK